MFQWIFLNIYLYFLDTNAYFLNSLDSDIYETQITNGFIKFKLSLDYHLGKGCTKVDDYGEFTYFGLSLFSMVCTIKRGCEGDFLRIPREKFCRMKNPITITKDVNSSNVICERTMTGSGGDSSGQDSLYSKLKIKDYFQSIFYLIQFSISNGASTSFILCHNIFSMESIHFGEVVESQNYSDSKFVKSCFVKYTLKFQFNCDTNYFGPNCIYKCIPDFRRKCPKKPMQIDEICNYGWVAIPINVTVTNNDNCGVVYKKTDIRLRCLVINACQSNTSKIVCVDGFECVPEFNNSAICAKFIHFYQNPKYPFIKNFTRTNLMHNESLIIHVSESLSINTTGKIYSAFWSHDLNPSDITVTILDRNTKNAELLIKGNKLKIRDSNKSHGYDYSIYAVIQSYNYKTTAIYKVILTIINLPTKLIVHNSIYVYYTEILNITSDGWPNDYMVIKLVRSDINFQVNFPYSSTFVFPKWKTKIFALYLNVFFDTRDGLNTTFSSLTYHTTKAFHHFHWKNSPYVLNESDILTCIHDSLVGNDISIVQISGSSEIAPEKDIITITDYKPGEYIIACSLHDEETKDTFYRYKMFEIHKAPETLCILPFPPAIGVIIKCYCIVFPPGEDNYFMVLSDISTNNVITRTSNNYLRIPYIILSNRKYRITCHYTDYYKEAPVKLNHSFDFYLIQKSEIPALNYNAECMEYGSLPDEYLIKESESIDELIFYNQLFYLNHNPQMVYNIFLLFIAIIMNNAMLGLIIKGYEKDLANEIASIFLQTEKLYKRNLMRRINNKVTNISFRQFEAFKELIEDFRAKHMSIGSLSEYDDNDS